MTEAGVEFNVEGLDGFYEKLRKLSDVVADLRPLWETLASDFYKEEKKIFQLRGPGRYADLSPDYKVQKFKRAGFAYPILLRRGDLAASLTQRGAPRSHLKIEPGHMELGTTIPYAKFHHSTEGGRKRLPRRPLWDENPDSPMFKRWDRTAEVYLQKAGQRAFDGKD